jgi:hypothetical protein
MTRKELAHLVAIDVYRFCRDGGRLHPTDDTVIWDSLDVVAQRSKAADAVADRLDKAPVAAIGRFVRMVRGDSILEALKPAPSWVANHRSPFGPGGAQ